MLEIAESNSETSNNSIRPAVAMLAISIAKLAATALAVPIIATPPKLITIAPLRRNACKAAGSCAASGVS
jgi:hypothetical protein